MINSYYIRHCEHVGGYRLDNLWIKLCAYILDCYSLYCSANSKSSRVKTHLQDYRNISDWNSYCRYHSSSVDIGNSSPTNKLVCQFNDFCVSVWIPLKEVLLPVAFEYCLSIKAAPRIQSVKFINIFYFVLLEKLSYERNGGERCNELCTCHKANI
jgi:hypothetical protein